MIHDLDFNAAKGSFTLNDFGHVTSHAKMINMNRQKKIWSPDLINSL